MSIKGVIPEKYLRLMSKEDRKPLGKAGFTADEFSHLYQAKKEKDMHNTFSDWLTLNRIPFIHARMDKKSTIANGVPDFTLMYQGLAVCFEFKMPGSRLNDDQERFKDLLQQSGTPIFVCYMAAEAIELTRKILKL